MKKSEYRFVAFDDVLDTHEAVDVSNAWKTRA